MSYDPYKPSLHLTEAMSINVTAKQMADAFWSLPSDEMADFFCELDKVAGGRLCLQMAAVVDVIQKRSVTGEYGCLNGFQTMLNHAQDYHGSAAFYRVEDAKRDIARMVRGAKEELRAIK